MISARYAPAICLLLACALVPTVIHTYGGDAPGDGLRTDAIPASLLGYSSRPSGRNENWGRNRFDSHDWFERNYTSGTDEVRLTVVRSYDYKALYHHPELAVAYGPRFGSSFDEHEVVRFDARPEIPVHVLHPAPGARAMAFYVMHHDGAFVENPLWFQLRTAGALLFSRRKPMTLFFAHDLSVPASASIDDLAGVRLLFAAIDAFAGSHDARPER